MDYAKIDRTNLATFLDVTPKEAKETWEILGVGIQSFAIDFNPNITSEKWITKKNATSTLESNSKQGDVTQTMHKGDPCFEFVYSLMDKTGADVETNILDVDYFEEISDESGIKTYKAKQSQGMVAITSYGGETATIGYTLYYNGDPIEGTVVITDGKPVFTPNN